MKMARFSERAGSVSIIPLTLRAIYGDVFFERFARAVAAGFIREAMDGEVVVGVAGDVDIHQVSGPFKHVLAFGAEVAQV